MNSRFWNKKPPVSGRKMIMEALEERIVMDAAVDFIPDSHAFNASHAAVPSHASLDSLSIGNSLMLKQLIGPNADTHAAASVDNAHQAPAKTGPSLSSSLDVVLVSDALEGKNQIAAAASPNAKVIVYNAAKDNLDTLNAQLSELVSSTGKKISHLAVASHGTDGILQLGSDKLDFAAALSHRSSFKSLAENLDPHAQIQLYSCSLAGDEAGKNLVNSIALMTGADVYASTDTTGAKPHNWTLEYSSYPKAPMASLFDADKLEHVPGELAQHNVTTLPPDAQIDAFPRELPGTTRMPIVAGSTNQVAFSADSGNGYDVYKTNNTTKDSGQSLLMNLAPLNPDISQITSSKGGTPTEYFVAVNSDAGHEVFSTTLGAAVTNFANGEAGYDPNISQLTAQGNAVYFVGTQTPDNPETGIPAGRELWASHGGTPPSGYVTDLPGVSGWNLGSVSDFNGAAGVSGGRGFDPNITEVTPANNNNDLYFVAQSPTTTSNEPTEAFTTPDASGNFSPLWQGYELWRTDGTPPAAGSGNITNFPGVAIYHGAVTRFSQAADISGYDPHIHEVTAASDVNVYMVASAPDTRGPQIFMSNGTEPVGTLGDHKSTENGGTTWSGNVTTFLPPTNDALFHELTWNPGAGAPNRLDFVADNGDGFKIWRWGGNPGTSSLPPAPNTEMTGAIISLSDPQISQLTPLPNGDLFFVANGGVAGAPNYEIFRIPSGGAEHSEEYLTNFPDTPLPIPMPWNDGTKPLDLYYTGYPAYPVKGNSFATPGELVFPSTTTSASDSVVFPAHVNPHIKLLTFAPDPVAQGNPVRLWFEADSMDGRSREIYSVDPAAVNATPAQRTYFGLNNPDFGFLTNAGGQLVFVANNVLDPLGNAANPGDGQQIFAIVNDAPQIIAGPTTVLEDNNNHNYPIPLPDAIRVGDLDRGDALKVTVKPISGFDSIGFTLWDPSPDGSIQTIPNADGSWTIQHVDPSTGLPSTALKGDPSDWLQQTYINQVLSSLEVVPSRNTNSDNAGFTGNYHQLEVSVSDQIATTPTKALLTDQPVTTVPGYDVVGQLTIKAVNDHPVFNPQAIPGSPTGTAINNQFPGVMWGGTDYPTLDEYYQDTRTIPDIPQKVVSTGTLIFNDANMNRIAVTDVDAYEILRLNDPTSTAGEKDGIIHVNLITGGGTVKLANNGAGLTADTAPNRVEGSTAPLSAEGAIFGFSGTIENINKALDGMMFRPAPYYTGKADITLILDDTNPFLHSEGVAHTGDPESGEIEITTPIWTPMTGLNYTKVQPYPGMIPRDPIVGSILIDVQEPADGFYGKLLQI